VSKFSTRNLPMSIIDAAKKLSCCFKNEITEADIMRLCLEGHLTLSAYLTSDRYGRECQQISNENITPKALERVTQLGAGSFFDLLLHGDATLFLQSAYLDSNHDKPEPSAVKGLFIAGQNGHIYRLEKENQDSDYWMDDGPHYKPCGIGDGNQPCINADSLSRYIQEHKGDVESQISVETPKQFSIHDLPKELQVAIDVYYEFWHEKPEDINQATKTSIAHFISGKIENISTAAIERIDSMARPQKFKSGGVPKSEFRTYKGKSKENL